MEQLSIEYQESKLWWRIAEIYFKEHGFTEHQIDSYNIFMREKLSTIITSVPITYKKNKKNYLINFDSVYIEKPEYIEPNGISKKLTPNECRIRNLSYLCRIYANITRYTLEDINDTNSKVVDTEQCNNCFIGSIPCMVLSDYCNLIGDDLEALADKEECIKDSGGYFIINGIEKVLMSQDRMAHNEIFVFKSKDKNKISIPIPGSDKSRSLACDWYAELRSYSSRCEPNVVNAHIRYTKTQLHNGEESRMYVDVPNLKCPIPWPVLFKAYGVTDEDDIIKCVCSSDDVEMIKLLKPSLECSQVSTQKEALEWLKNYVLTTQEKEQKMDILKNILRVKLFQNVPDANLKKYYLGHMTYQLLSTVLKRRKQDDRDHYGKKRIDSAGGLLNNLFRSVWKRIVREVTNDLVKKRTSELCNIFLNKITNYIRTPFAKGIWTANKTNNKSSKVGVSQLLNRHNYISTLSNLRRVITPSDKNSKIIKPRHLHNTQWCFICPCETPEGQSTGLIKNMSMFCDITTSSNPDNVLIWLKQYSDIVSLLEYKELLEQIHGEKIFINGNWVGNTTAPKELISRLRLLRRQSKVYYQVSFAYNNEGITIHTDCGRVIAPFIILKDGKLPELDLDVEHTWQGLLDQGIIEYLDPLELETLTHAEKPWDLTKEHTHSIIHPIFLSGISGCTIPFPDHNQSPRNIYQCLSPETNVLMSDGTRKEIKDVKVGDDVITFNPKTMNQSITKVVHQYVRRTHHKIYKLTTVSGREIVATGNHKFMTNEGWKTVEEMDITQDNKLKNTKIGINLAPIGLSGIPIEIETILDESIFIARLDEHNIKHATDYLSTLKDIGLLPLKNDNPKLAVLSRIIGYTLGNKKSGIRSKVPVQTPVPYAEYFFESKLDSEMFENDIKYLGFTSNKTYRESNDGNCTVIYTGIIPSLLTALGVTNQNSIVPDWVMEGSDNVKREFLSGFQGGNPMNTPETHTEFSKLITVLNKNNNRYKILVEQYTTLLQYLGIKVSDIKSHAFDMDYDNLKDFIKYYDTIGYSYCHDSQVNVGIEVERLKYLNRTSEYVSLEEWSEYIDTKSCSIFVPIESIKEEQTDQIVSDITVESDNHSFIAGNNFLSSNCAMGKQALGINTTNFLHRYDTSSHILCYPQKPLVNTIPMKYLGTESLPTGQNLIVAVLSAGYNQEDSVIINKRAIDNGLLRSIHYSTYSESCYRKSNILHEIKKPNKSKVKETRLKAYNRIDEDGIPKEGTPLEKKDIIIGKTNTSNNITRDASVILKSNGMDSGAVIETPEAFNITEKGYSIIDKSILTINHESFRTVKLRLSQMRVPQIGDKVASRSAQKGIIGMILPPEDMPFCEDNGITPDLLMNPNAFPSRMTVGQALETLLGKTCCFNGIHGNATPFEQEFDEKLIFEELKKYGLDEHGDEVMINGYTGEKMKCKIFMGPVYYQRLKHMVDDKIHARSQDGLRETLTRQPVEGRKRGGGFRVGEMEIWALNSHGASKTIIERTIDNSDGYEKYVCDFCGNTAIATHETKRYECKRCKQNTFISKIRLPYSCKLVFQELQACCIGTWYNVDTNTKQLDSVTPQH